MKHFLKFLQLRARDLLLSAGRPPYSYADHQAYGLTGTSYSLRKAIQMCDVVPSLFGDKPTKGIAIPRHPGFILKVDRLGRTHLPKALRERIL